MKELHFKKGKLPCGCIGALCFTALLAVLFFLVEAYIWGIFALLPFALGFGVREGVRINLQERMYKSYLSIMGVTPATWKPIPDGTKIGIRILKLSANRAIGPIVMNSVAKDESYELYLVFPGPRKVVLKTSYNIKLIYEDAQYIRQHMGFDVIVDQRIPDEKYL